MLAEPNCGENQIWGRVATTGGEQIEPVDLDEGVPPSVAGAALPRTREQRVIVVLEGDRFLRKMARMLVGTLVEVGLRRLSPSEAAAVLHGRVRTAAVATAPAAGLMLDHVFYSDEPRGLREGKSALAAAELPGWPTVPSLPPRLPLTDHQPADDDPSTAHSGRHC